jgi:cell wall-associated NlpC family hydrolase
MPRPKHRVFIGVTLALLAVTLAATVTSRAHAKTYSDVPKTHWAYAAITSVTDRGASGHWLLHDHGSAFKPGKAVLRSEMARALVSAAGRQTTRYAPVVIGDVPPEHPYYADIQIALKYKFMALDKAGNFSPDKVVIASSAETLLVRWLKVRYPASSWKLLTSLSAKRWEPNPGWRPKAPSYLPSIIASRQLQLRVNHSSADEQREVTPGQPISRAEVASMFKRGFDVGSTWQLSGLAGFADITFPPLSDRQKEITSFALKFIGYPYVWAGEYPTKNSPYGYQKAGGFDCSGFAFYVMKMKFGYPITVNERGGGAMAAKAKPRITRKNLTGGDLIFFGYQGPKSAISAIYHVGLYLGNGWFIHSTGSSDGVTLASLNSSTYWKTYFAWGRRLLGPQELAISKTPAE